MPDLAREIGRAFSFLEQVQEDSEEISATPQTFTWNGTEFACTVGKMIKRNLFGAGGLTPDNDLRIDVRIVNIGGSVPEPGHMITYAGSQWRIEAVEYPAGGVITLLCNDPNRAAGIIEREM